MVIQGRKKAMNMIKDILEERKSSTGKGKKEDFLDDILGEVVGKKIHVCNLLYCLFHPSCPPGRTRQHS